MPALRASNISKDANTIIMVFDDASYSQFNIDGGQGNKYVAIAIAVRIAGDDVVEDLAEIDITLGLY